MIYLDNNATTPVDPSVFEAMRPFLTDRWGNPSSGYGFGKQLKRALDNAREQSAALVGADPGNVVFTACGTESINTAVGSAAAAVPEKRHLITTAPEHSATLKVCRALEERDYALTVLPVRPEGMVEPEVLASAMREDTVLVSAIWANNETGVVSPVGKIAELCASRGIPLHLDAVQVAGKLPIDVKEVSADYLSLSGHKFRAPKGVGMLYVRDLGRFSPFMLGGGQEQGRRGGTENVAGIVGLGEAAALALQRQPEFDHRIRAYRDRLEQGLLEHIRGVRVNGSRESRLPNTSNMTFEGVDGEALMLALDEVGVCVSTGSACSTGSVRPSHVLTAMGLSASEARGSIRFSWGWHNREPEAEQVLGHAREAVARLRAETLPRRI